MVKSTAIVLMFVFWFTLCVWGLVDSFACVVSRHRINDTRYVLHDMDCNGVVDTVFEYQWNGASFIFMGSYPYSAFK